MNSDGSAYQTRAFFLKAPVGQRYCLFHTPAVAAPKASILYLHPFAEEMHAARRVVAQQCRRLAASGNAVLQMDLLGCGDSSGDFGEATWSAWLDDVQLGLDWLRKESPANPAWIWGLRAGCLLACGFVSQHLPKHPDSPVNLLLWQPPASGQQQLQQFLRLHTAAQWLGRASAGESPTRLLAAGQPVRIAGYDLSPKLANELERASLDLPPGVGRIGIVEIADNIQPAGSPVDTQAVPSSWLARWIERWQHQGWTPHWSRATAPLFWQNVVESCLSAQLDTTTQQAIR